jgi:hypothetical protein
VSAFQRSSDSLPLFRGRLPAEAAGDAVMLKHNLLVLLVLVLGIGGAMEVFTIAVTYQRHERYGKVDAWRTFVVGTR